MRDSQERIVRDLLNLLRSTQLETIWASFSTGSDLIAEVERIRASLSDGPAAARDLAVLFAPTGALQEVAISSGFHDEYMLLADRHDKVVAG